MATTFSRSCCAMLSRRAVPPLLCRPAVAACSLTASHLLSPRIALDRASTLLSAMPDAPSSPDSTALPARLS